jgi:hypothetical protein
MTATKQQIVNMIGQLSDKDASIILEIVNRFLPDERATPHDEQLYEEAMAAVARGEYVKHEEID